MLLRVCVCCLGPGDSVALYGHKLARLVLPGLKVNVFLTLRE